MVASARSDCASPQQDRHLEPGSRRVRPPPPLTCWKNLACHLQPLLSKAGSGARSGNRSCPLYLAVFAACVRRQMIHSVAEIPYCAAIDEEIAEFSWTTIKGEYER